MRTPVVRSLSVSLFVVLLAAKVAAASEQLTGTVTDPSGQPLPRAYITVTNRTGEEIARTFANADGTFHVAVDTFPGCRIDAFLSGFRTAGTDCGARQPIRLVLTIAPIQEAIIVSATRDEAPAGQIGASVTVFNADEIELRQMPPVANLLRSAPGVTVVGGGGAGTLTSLFVRGGESNYTKVLLDGIPLNEPGGAFNFSNVTSEHLDRVELVRGAQSALFGSDAMAGIVQMFTKRAPAGPPRVTLFLEGGSYTSFRGAAGASGIAGPFDYSVQLARTTTDNRVPNNEFHNTTLSGSGGLAINPRTSLRFVARAELGRTGVPGQTAFGRPDLDAFFNRRDGVGGVTFAQQITSALRQRATYALAVSKQQSTNLMIDPPYTPRFEGRIAPFEFFDFAYDSRTGLRRHHASYQADWRIASTEGRAGTHLLTFAFDWDGERGTLENRLAGSIVQPSRDNVGWILQQQALWPRVFVVGGVRLEHNGSFGTDAVPRGAIAILVHRASGLLGDTKLKAAGGRGIKEPTFLQSFSPSPAFLGNPELEPERSRSVETGIEQRLANERAKVELTWFDNRFRNIIATRTLSFNPFTSQFFNIGMTKARGLELSGECAPASNLLIRAGYTLLDSQITRSTAPANDVFKEGQPLFRRPRHSGYIVASWNGSRVALEGVGIFVGNRVDSDFVLLSPPIVSNPGYKTWDVRASYFVSPRLSWIAAIDNLTNADYQEPLGYPALKRAFRTGARLTF